MAVLLQNQSASNMVKLSQFAITTKIRYCSGYIFVNFRYRAKHIAVSKSPNFSTRVRQFYGFLLVK